MQKRIVIKCHFHFTSAASFAQYTQGFNEKKKNIRGTAQTDLTAAVKQRPFDEMNN